jgi:hypothetical protein
MKESLNPNCGKSRQTRDTVPAPMEGLTKSGATCCNRAAMEIHFPPIRRIAISRHRDLSQTMTRLVLSLVLITCIAGGCEQSKRPPGVLSREEYASLLIDVYLTEAKLSQLPIQQDSAMRLYLAYEPELLSKQGLSDSVVRLTYEYYVNHPKELEQVYAAVVDTLSLREQKANQTEP